MLTSSRWRLCVCAVHGTAEAIQLLDHQSSKFIPSVSHCTLVRLLTQSQTKRFTVITGPVGHFTMIFTGWKLGFSALALASQLLHLLHFSCREKRPRHWSTLHCETQSRSLQFRCGCDCVCECSPLLVLRLPPRCPLRPRWLLLQVCLHLHMRAMSALCRALYSSSPTLLYPLLTPFARLCLFCCALDAFRILPKQHLCSMTSI